MFFFLLQELTAVKSAHIKTKKGMDKKLEAADKVNAKLGADLAKALRDCTELKAAVVEAALEAEEAQVQLDELLDDKNAKLEIREGTRGKPLGAAFVNHCRTLLATGGSARSVREQIALNGIFFLEEDNARSFQEQLPEVRWFQFQRESMGLESMVFTFIRLARAERVDQWGFDETALDGVPTLNQWCRVMEDNEAVTLTIECAGLLPGSTSDKVIRHLRAMWARGQEVVTMVRAV